MPLSPKERQVMKAKAHALKPIVGLGNQGLTANVHSEIDRGLYDHELIKIRLPFTIFVNNTKLSPYNLLVLSACYFVRVIKSQQNKC
jgi:RNA-binding protein YhbY